MLWLAFGAVLASLTTLSLKGIVSMVVQIVFCTNIKIMRRWLVISMWRFGIWSARLRQKLQWIFVLWGRFAMQNMRLWLGA